MKSAIRSARGSSSYLLGFTVGIAAACLIPITDLATLRAALLGAFIGPCLGHGARATCVCGKNETRGAGRGYELKSSERALLRTVRSTANLSVAGEPHIAPSRPFIVSSGTLYSDSPFNSHLATFSWRVAVCACGFTEAHVVAPRLSIAGLGAWRGEMPEIAHPRVRNYNPASSSHPLACHLVQGISSHQCVAKAVVLGACWL